MATALTPAGKLMTVGASPDSPLPIPKGIVRPLPDWKYVDLELRKKGVTLQLLWLEYREVHPDGYGYSQFANLHRVWKRQVDVVMRQEHRAGEKLFVDFPGDKLPIYDRRTGEVVLQAELFVAVAGASNYLFAEAFASQELLYWVTGHTHAFEAMGGCHEIVVSEMFRGTFSLFCGRPRYVADDDDVHR